MTSDKPLPKPLVSRNEWCYKSRKRKAIEETSQPIVSVVIPSYNQGHFLESTIRSVLQQDYPKIECIVIDGGSKDNSRAILEYYDPWITYWQSEPDNGQADAINLGLDKASGGIAMFLNSDDMIFPGAIKKVVAEFQKHPDALVIHGNRVLMSAEGEVLGWGNNCDFDPKESGYTIPSECAYWRTNALGEPQRFHAELKFALDLEFFCRLFLRGRFQRIDAFLGYFRVHDDAKSFTMQDTRKSESTLLWREFFGVEWDPSLWKSPKNPIRQYVLGIKNCRYVLFPWTLRKLKKVFNRS